MEEACCRRLGAGVLPTCAAVACADPGTPTGGVKIGGAYGSGDEVTFACNSGVFTSGDSRRICEIGGQWSGTQPSCRIDGCSDPGMPASGTRVGDSFTVGAQVVFNCDSGFTLAGTSPRTCGADGEWSGTQPSCTIKDCGNPGTPAYGAKHGPTTYTVGNQLVFTCDTGYTLTGDSPRTCGADGQWSGVQPSCSALSESWPPTLQSGRSSRIRCCFA